jgi:UPF0042 nucleotide-binding protein
MTDGMVPPADDAANAETAERQSDLVLITGMSGAGRSEAIHTFEDLGYFCIDNLPPALLRQLVELTNLPGSRVRRMAVVCDVRGREFFSELSATLDDLEAAGHDFRILFLAADDRALVRRFKETRRRHPLADVGSVVDGIRTERELLDAMGERADLVIDTSDLKPQELRQMIRDRFIAGGREGALSVVVSSFGFKYGAPIDADVVMDVRFLPNPHYIAGLRAKTGLDKPVRAFVLERPETTEFLERWLPLLDTLLPGYLGEGKSNLHIALGCTGGRHRSVALAEATAAHLRSAGHSVSVGHRDITKAEDW